MKILLLGGTGDALALARRLNAAGHDCVYSVAGLGRTPDYRGVVRTGGFGGAMGLAAWLRAEAVDVLIDATHPFAARISRNAAEAGAETGVPVWGYRRPRWRSRPGDRWITVPDWPTARAVIADYRRPFLALGGKLLPELDEIPAGQHWLLRCLPTTKPRRMTGLTVVEQRGPFGVESERALMQTHDIDVLVCKNSGGTSAAAKLDAARELAIPVVMIERPALPRLAVEHHDIDALVEAVRS